MNALPYKHTTQIMLLIWLLILPQMALAEQIKIQNNLDVILMFDEVLNRQNIKIKSKPTVIMSGEEGVVKLAEGDGLKNIHLKMRYLAGQSGSPLHITFGNNMGKCFADSNSERISTSIEYDKSKNCGNDTVHITVTGQVADYLDGL